MEFYASDYPGSLPMELLYLSVMMLPRVFNLVFYKALFSNKYYIL
jgi:hypothetical protein